MPRRNIKQYSTLVDRIHQSLSLSVRTGSQLMTWWHHQMETDSALLALCARHSPVTPHKGPSQRAVTRRFDVCLILIPAWISNHTPSKMSDDITYPFTNFNSCTVEVWDWIVNCVPHFKMDKTKPSEQENMWYIVLRIRNESLRSCRHVNGFFVLVKHPQNTIITLVSRNP